MKKKVLTVALVLALLAIVVSGTLAYFTAEDEVTNTFTVGSVKIEIFENDKETDSDTITFEDPLMPIVNITTPSEDVSYMDKAVKVKNTGANGAYIRVHIAIPTQLVGYLYLDLNETGWARQTDTTATVEGVNYTVFTYDYNTEVTSGNFTGELLKGVYLTSEADLKDNPDTATADLEFCKPDGKGGYTFSGFTAHSKTNSGYTSNKVNVLVASEAIQARGFEKGATDALNTGFGEKTNPWQ